MPLAYDRHVLHDGLKNTYTLYLSNENIVLNQFLPSQVHKTNLGVGSEKKGNPIMMSKT